MSDISINITRLLLRELEGFKRELDLFPDEASMWRTVPGVTNSAGNLALHVAGGPPVPGGMGNRRDRLRAGPGRRVRRRGETRGALYGGLDRAAAVVRDVLSRAARDTLAAAFPEAVLGVSFTTQVFLLHLCAHAAFHLGQAGYLRRALTGDARSSGPLLWARWEKEN